MVPLIACSGYTHSWKDGRVIFQLAPMPFGLEMTEGFSAWHLSLAGCLDTTPDALSRLMVEWLIREAEQGNVRLLLHHEPNTAPTI